MSGLCTPTVDEVILSVGTLLRQGVSIHLQDAYTPFVHVSTMELGVHRAVVSLSHNTTWVTALSGSSWPPRPGHAPSSPSSPSSDAMDDTGAESVGDSADASVSPHEDDASEHARSPRSVGPWVWVGPRKVCKNDGGRLGPHGIAGRPCTG